MIGTYPFHSISVCTVWLEAIEHWTFCWPVWWYLAADWSASRKLLAAQTLVAHCWFKPAGFEAAELQAFRRKSPSARSIDPTLYWEVCDVVCCSQKGKMSDNISLYIVSYSQSLSLFECFYMLLSHSASIVLLCSRGILAQPCRSMSWKLQDLDAASHANLLRRKSIWEEIDCWLVLLCARRALTIDGWLEPGPLEVLTLQPTEG